MSLIKSTEDLQKIRLAGPVLAEVLSVASKATAAGVRLIDLDRIIDQTIRDRGCTPSFLGYDGFPNASCLSLNEQVVHGIPDDRVLKHGDILGIDVGLWYEGVCVDAAVTVIVKPLPAAVRALVNHTRQALNAGIRAVRPGNRIGAISAAVQAVGDRHHLGIVTNLTGHGVGNHVHEDPPIPNFGRPSDGILMRPGMVLAIEPMFTLGKGSVETEIDGWGVVTADRSFSAHFEHTVIVTDTSVEIVTRTAKMEV